MIGLLLEGSLSLSCSHFPMLERLPFLLELERRSMNGIGFGTARRVDVLLQVLNFVMLCETFASVLVNLTRVANEPFHEIYY